MPKFAANLSFLFAEVPFAQRFARAAAAGFAGVEYLFPYDWPAGEVAGWLAAGKTNPEIDIILASNVRTVEKHVEAVLKKLGVENRTAAAVLILAGEHTRNGC